MRTLLCSLVLAAVSPAATVGVVDFKVTASPKTQACFNRAVAMLHNFWFEEARETFEGCAAADPGFQMAWWGVAMTHNHSLWNRVWPDEAKAALKKITAPEKLSARERAYVDAVRLLFGEGPTKDASKRDREIAYAAAMEKIFRAYPDDLEAATFYSLSLIATRKFIDAGAIALDVYTKNPEHPGAAHYIIHAFDDPKHAILALPAARRYAKIAPEAHHARHMPSHIFLQLGMWPETVASNEDSWAASVAWQTRKKMKTDARDYHSQYWLAYGYLQQGRYADAWKIYEAKKKDIIDAQGDGEVYRYWSDLGAAIVIETRAWDRAESVFTDPVTIRRSGGDHAHAASNPGRAIQALTGGLAAARSGGDVKPFLDLLEQTRQMAIQRDNKVNAARSEAQSLMVQAAAAARAKNFDAATSLLAKAGKLEETDEPSGPPDIIKPSHELFGEVLLEAGKPKEAMAQFQKSLARQKNRSRSVLGLARAARAAGEGELALQMYRQFLTNWAQAPEGPEKNEASSYVNSAGSRGAVSSAGQ